MAHYTSGTANGPGAAAAFLDILVAHLQANGWTKLDGAAGSYAMMKGVPLDATAGNAPLVYLNVANTTNIGISICWDWEAASKTRIGTITTANLIVQDASFSYWIRANGQAFGVCTKANGTHNKAYAGYVRRGLAANRSGITKTTAAIAVGATSIPVASDMTGKLQVGQKVMLVNQGGSNASANKTNAELVTISAISPTAITVSATTKAYDAGAFVGQRPHSSVQSVSNADYYVGYSNGFALLMDPVTGAYTAGGAAGTVTNIQIGNTSYNDPAGDSGQYVAGVTSVDKSSGPTIGTLYHFIVFYNSGSTVAVEDTLTDDSDSFVNLSNNGSWCSAMGPVGS